MLTKKERDEMWAYAKANQAKLKSCHDHDFSIDLTPEKVLGKAWQCVNCGGHVDSLHKGWYEEGREHERLAQQNVPPLS